MQVSQIKGIFPGTFTMGNVVCGFLAILSAFDGDITTACWLIVLAAFLDVLDGKIARLSGTSSNFGIELDSLADFLSFGVAPAVIIYIVKLSSLGKWGWVICVVYIMAVAFRLARFNILATTEEKTAFLGLPAPPAAMALASYVIFSYYLWDDLEYGEYLVSIVILLSALMITQIEYDALPDRFNTRKNRLKLLFIVIASVAVLAKPRLLLFPVVILYVIIGLVREMYRFFYVGVGLVTGRQSRNQKKAEDSDE